MPEHCLDVLRAGSHEANTVFFGLEQSGGAALVKVYLEFWDVVREKVSRTGTRAAAAAPGREMGQHAP
ncbi:hypothetical protein LP420_40155 [Massilia sp. B-10]|nr:hypothetical protein LP420_40155 [Massilia sp. B-10]